VKGGVKMEIDEKIKQRRMELGWSQRELARRMGYSDNSTLARIEQGKVDVYQNKIVQFSEVLGVSIAYLMDWQEEQKKNDIQADIILRMRSDTEFMSAVETLYKLDKEKLQSINTMLHTLLK
jgi:transcriptional regulator with XRE-family HTH domain